MAEGKRRITGKRGRGNARGGEEVEAGGGGK